MQANSIKIALLFSEGVSLWEFINKGLYEREIALYRSHFEMGFLEKLYLLTYGLEEGIKVSDDFVEIIPIPKSLNNKVGRYLYPYLMYFLKKKIFKSVDIVKTNQLNGIVPGLFYRLLNDGLLYYRSGYSYVEFTNQLNPYSPRLAFWWVVERIALRVADLVTASSDHDVARSQKIVSKKIFSNNRIVELKVKQLRNYINTEVFQPVSNKNKSQDFIFIGRLTAQKNLVSALDPFVESGLNINIYGEGEYRRYLEEKYSASRNIRFMGVVNNSELPQILNNYSFYVIASHYEGTPKSLLEAMACGLLCIGSPASSISTLIEDCGVLAEGFDSESFGRAYSRAIKLPTKEFERLTALANIKVNKLFSLSKIAEQERSYIREALANKWTS